MWKIASIIISVLLISGLYVSASEAKLENIDELLESYQSAIDKVNAELGSTIYIPEENKEKVYHNIKNMSPSEVEALLRQEYKTFILDTSYKAQSHSNKYIKDSAINASPSAQSKYGKYKRESAMGKEPGPGFIPNFSGHLHLTPLK